VSRSGNHRSAKIDGGNVSEDEPGARAGGGGAHRQESRKGALDGRNASALCVMAAFLAFCTALIMELIAYTRQEGANPFFNGVAGLFAVAALGTGVYAQVMQLRHWRQRVRSRLQVGLTVGVLTLLLVAVNFYKKCIPPAAARPVPVKTSDLPAAQEDRSLFKSGWFGELQQDGVLAVVSAFAENASESRQFNRCVAKPVSYAALSVVNMGSPVPVVLKSLQVGLLLDSGEEVRSLAVKPLLREGGWNQGLVRRLAEPQTLAAGAMLPDIPVCLEPGFRWERVRGVKLTLNARSVLIPGRIMTAAEKSGMLEKATVSARSSATTNLSAEAWFKDL